MHQSPFYRVFPDTVKYIFTEILKKNFCLQLELFFFTQQQDTNSIQVPTDCKLGDNRTYSGIKTKVQKFHGLKVLKS